ncbi:mitochondrial potassium channel ATP-binding subunit-like [Lineus longissimus]|uniref:mitochondrial potassium channel ATP-binding subunit-like n=1 Tax=Lineus longissimus TaxID=88925 RepID=UPI002B4EC607
MALRMLTNQAHRSHLHLFTTSAATVVRNHGGSGQNLWRLRQMVKPSNQTRGFQFHTVQSKIDPQKLLNQNRKFLQKGKQGVLNILKSSFAKPVIGFALSGTAIALAKENHKPKQIFVNDNGNGDTEWSRVAEQKDDSGQPEPDFDWKEFCKMLWPECWYLLGAIASAFAVAVVNIQIPAHLGELVNVVSEFTKGATEDYIAAMKEPVMKLLTVYGLQAGLTFIYITLLSSIGERLAAQLRKKLFHSIIQQDMEFFDTHRGGEIINRLTSDVQDFKSSFKMCISQGLRSTTQVIGSTVALLMISPKLTGVIIAVIPFIVLTGALIGSSLRKLSRAAQQQVAKAVAVADEAVGNMSTVRAFAMEGMETELYNKEVNESCRQNQKLGLGIGVFQGLANFALNGIVLGMLFAGGCMLATDKLSPGDLMSFLVATQTIQRSLAQMSLLFGQAVRGMSAGARVFEYIALQPKIALSGGVQDNQLIELARSSQEFHCVQFEDVKFAYPSRKEQVVLHDFNINIPSGKVVALCGLSGAGKSTVAALLEHFYDIDSGTIHICGRDIKTLDPTWLRGKVLGFIKQEPQLFATSVKENIRYGKPDASDEEIYEAAKLANAHKFIEGFPDGYDTIVGERGTTVSGGQKQRIAIARALLKNPAILILDEATSALDAESERLVQEALDRVMKGRTVIIIAHRLSTIKNADLIAVVAKGSVAEIGNHDDLMRRKGLYWNLVKQQYFEQENE